MLLFYCREPRTSFLSWLRDMASRYNLIFLFPSTPNCEVFDANFNLAPVYMRNLEPAPTNQDNRNRRLSDLEANTGRVCTFVRYKIENCFARFVIYFAADPIADSISFMFTGVTVLRWAEGITRYNFQA